MWRRIPKIPVLLLVALVGLWGWGRMDRPPLSMDLRPLIGPAFSLGHVSSGSWNIEWPVWPESRGDPYLYVRGQGGFSNAIETAGAIHLRVVPPDAVRLGSARSTDPEHWFAAGTPWDGDTVAWLDRERARTVEVRLDRPLSTESGSAWIEIAGGNDSRILEGEMVGEAIRGGLAVVRTVLAVVLGCGLCVWFGVALHVRRRRSNRARFVADDP